MSADQTTPNWAQEPKLSIRRRAVELRKLDSAARHEALLAVSERLRPIFSLLYHECENTGGHDFTMPDRCGPDMWGKLRLTCSCCGMVERDT